MKSTTTGCFRQGVGPLALSTILAFACVDSPAAPQHSDIPIPSSADAVEVLLNCSVAVGTWNFTCDGAAPHSTGSEGAPSHNLIIGGQYQYLRLFADSVSIEDGELVAQVKVQNLSLQQLATLDGRAVGRRPYTARAAQPHAHRPGPTHRGGARPPRSGWPIPLTPHHTRPVR